MKNSIDQLNISIKFDIYSIKIIKYNFVEEIKMSKHSKEISWGFAVNIKNTVNLKKKIIKSIVYIGILKNDEGEPVCEIVVDFSFKIENLEEIAVKLESDEIEIPDAVFHTLNGIAISTCRGILVNKNAGTYLERAYLPVINPSELQKIEKIMDTAT